MREMPAAPSFIFPDVARERGEIDRVSEEVFNETDADDFFLRFARAAKVAPLVDLSEDLWRTLENTDSYDISSAGWTEVEQHAVEGHPGHPRDWQSYKTLYEQGSTIEAPIVLRTGGTLHLVAGNTRLMVARALGVTPKVLLVELKK